MNWISLSRTTKLEYIQMPSYKNCVKYYDIFKKSLTPMSKH